MGEPGAAFAFVARADVVIDGHRNDRHRMVFVKHNPQTVIESELFDWGDRNLKSFLHVMARLITLTIVY